MNGFADFCFQEDNSELIRRVIEELDAAQGLLCEEAEGADDVDHAKKTLTEILAKKPKKTKGLLVVFEGIDGAGKSTQVENLIDWLKEQNYDVVYSEWNSHPAIKPAIKGLKKKRALSPMLYCLLHAADMIARYEWDIEPALRENRVVVCDRYYYTSLVRDEARDVDVSILESVYNGLRTPDILFHCSVPIHTAFTRLIKEKGLTYYGTGMDLNLADSKEENYVKYESILDKLYNKILPKVPTYYKLDMSKSIEQIGEKVKSVMASKFGIGKYRQ